MTTIVNYTQQKRDEDDDMSLADIMSLRISSPSPMEEKVKKRAFFCLYVCECVHVFTP